MPKGVKRLEKELRDAENILEHYEYHHRVSDLRRLPTREELESRIAKLKKALEKAKEHESKRPYKPEPQEQDGGRRKSRRRKSRRGTRRH